MVSDFAPSGSTADDGSDGSQIVSPHFAEKTEAVKAKQRRDVNSMANKWRNAGSKWPSYILRFSEKCGREFENKKGYVPSVCFDPPDPCLLQCFTSEYFLVRPVYVFDLFMRLRMTQVPTCPNCNDNLTGPGGL